MSLLSAALMYGVLTLLAVDTHCSPLPVSGAVALLLFVPFVALPPATVICGTARARLRLPVVAAFTILAVGLTLVVLFAAGYVWGGANGCLE